MSLCNFSELAIVIDSDFTVLLKPWNVGWNCAVSRATIEQKIRLYWVYFLTLPSREYKLSKKDRSLIKKCFKMLVRGPSIVQKVWLFAVDTRYNTWHLFTTVDSALSGTAFSLINTALTQGKRKIILRIQKSLQIILWHF